MPTKIEKDAISGRETTGHEWDGIKELDTPLPRWWLTVLYATIVFAVVWCVLYPSVPLGRSYFHGLLGYSQRDELTKSMERAAADQAGMRGKLQAVRCSRSSATPSCAASRLPAAVPCSPTIVPSVTRRAVRGGRLSVPGRRQMVVGRQPRRHFCDGDARHSCRPTTRRAAR